MVNVAVAGGTGQVAREVIDALLLSNKHHIFLLSRKETPDIPIVPGVEWKHVDYNDKASLVEVLKGVHTLLSFVQVLSDPGQKSQRNLIDAAISAGVKRFAPSEYGSKDTTDMPWTFGKEEIREYLKEVNNDKNVLEYTLFQPGIFLDYLAFPHKTSKHLEPLQFIFDFASKRSIMVDGHEDAVMTLTTVADVAAVVARAVEYNGKWPTVGGIRGNRLTFSEIMDIGKRVRGNYFTVDKVKIHDLEAGDLNASWGLEAAHSAVEPHAVAAMLKTVAIGALLSSTKGAWDSSDEVNRMFPDYEFTQAEEFLAKIWEGKP